MGRSKMLQPAVRWLCLLLLTFQGATGQLSVGDPHSFRIEDLEAIDVTTQPSEDVVGDDPHEASATEIPPEDTTLADLGDALNPETISALEEEEIISVASATDFGLKVDSDVVTESYVVSSTPQLSRRILVSGTLPDTSVVPEASASFGRPPSLVRRLSDPNTGWLPNWPSHLIPSSSVSRNPTIRFPSDTPRPTPTPDEVTNATPVPSIVPSLTVSKVPVTQYFFDISSVAPSPPPGPLYDPDDLNLSGSIAPASLDDLNRPVVELASSIPELQSSAFMRSAEPVSVTPTLPVPPQTLIVTESSTEGPNVIEGTATVSVAPTVILPSVETEVVDNDLANENYNNVTTLVSEIPNDLDPETSGPSPPPSLPDYPEEKDDLETTTEALVDTSPPLPSTDPIAVLSEDPSGTGAAQPDPSATSTSPSLSESELVSSPSTNSLGHIRPTSIRTLQAANISRTPLWMLLSQSVPSQSVTTETTLTSSVVSIPVTDLLTTAVPTVVSTDDFSDLVEVSSGTDLVSSLLISSKFISPSSESTATTVDILDSRTLLEDAISSVVPSTSIFSTDPSTDTVTEPPVSITPTPSVIEFTTPLRTASPESTATTAPSYDPSNDDSIQPLDVNTPTPPILIETLENNRSISVTTPQAEQIDSSELPKESSASLPINTTVEYHETSGEPLIVTVPKDNSWPGDSLSIAEKGISAVVSTKVDTADWTPAIELTEKSVDSAQTTPSSTLTTDASSSVALTPPDLTGGFIPIISETTKPSSVLHSELMPENANISNTPAVTSIVASTSAPAESLSTLLESPFLTDSSNVQVPSVFTDIILASEHPHIVEQPVSSVVSNDGLMSSNLLLSTTTFPAAKSEPTSVSLTPSFNVSATSSELPLSINVLESETMTTTNLEPSMIVIEKFPSSSSSPIFATETLPTPTPSISLPSLSPTENMNVTSLSSVTSVVPSSTVSLSPSVDPSSPPVILPLPSPTASFPTTSDLSSLITPTVTEEKNEVSTVISNREGVPDEEELVPKELPTKGPEEVAEEVEETIVPEESFPPTTTPASTTTTSTTTTSTTTEKDITTKMTDPPTFTTTSSVPTTSPSTIPVTFMYPSESMPSLTTSMTFPNGTVFERPLPYVRALVAYSGKEFCQHRHNFRAMLAQWISQHLQEDRSVSPSEIEFFNMPQCGLPKPGPEDHINQLTENLGSSGIDFEEKLNTSLENGEKVTNVYFYVTESGKINPNLTEMFPLFPMDLEISEELTYLRAKVSQLELVRPDGSTDNVFLPEEAAVGTSVIVIIVIVTVVGLIIITSLIFFMVVKRRGATNNYYGRRCTPVSMDAYSMDSVSVYHSFRRKSKRRASGRSVKSYLNQAFDDPNGPSRPLNFAKLTHFISDIDGVYEEFATIPVNMPKYDELPSGVEDKNRYANVIPVPETRVLLKSMKDSHNSEYINANYVRGPRNESKYYIATQAPLDDTVADFWRMIWEQETRVVVMLTDFVEKGIDKCADYLPPSETLDCHRLYGDFQITLKSRDMREKFVVSNVQLKNLENNLTREVAHMWFTGWPASGVPNEETAFISYILDIRRTRKKLRAKGPIVIHCSPGTGRSGTFLACDLVMRQFEDQRGVDIPRTVYSIRRDRAGAVQTKEQYAFIYRVINLYASKLTTGNLDSL